MDLTRTTRLIQLEEGCRLVAFLDSRGIWTIAWGFNLEAHGYSKDEAATVAWTQTQADEALRDEIELVIAQIDKRWPKWRDLDDVRQAAIVSSVYQLGAPGASYFFATIAAIKAKDWDKAADQMLASRWAKQTPGRVKRNAAMIRSGVWPKEVNGAQFDADDDPHVASAPAQPAQSRMPAGPVYALEQGAGADQAVGANLPGNRPVTTLLSKKLTLAVLGLLAVILNQPLGLGLNDQQMGDLVKLVSAYVLGQAGVDAFAPVVKALVGGKS